MSDWSKIPDESTYPGGVDAWWRAHATDAEKANYEWIRATAPLDRPSPQVGHDGLIVRPGTVLPEWQYRLKYPKKPKREGRWRPR